jgi:hypothetical protein
MSDLFQDAQAEMDEQAKWGENRQYRVLKKLLVAIRLVAIRVKRIEERLDRIDPGGK